MGFYATQKCCCDGNSENYENSIAIFADLSFNELDQFNNASKYKPFAFFLTCYHSYNFYYLF